MANRRDKVRGYLADQVQAIRLGEPELRTLSPEAVHDVRVAVRRARTVLRVFDRLPSDGLDVPLRHWSDLLGAAREPAALRETLASACPATLMADLLPEIEAEQDAAVRAMLAELDRPEHRRLLEQLTALAVRDLGTPLHARRAARKAARRAHRRLEEAGAEDLDALHRARKAAKRARYAAEAIGDKKAARRWKVVQNALGEHRDGVIAVQHLAAVPGEEAAQARRELCERAATALARSRL